ncbi:adenine deaminase C-terminal domain-containing protein [Domibacillus epiphyticus]|uniref:adenine deaminase n=1 Tax=Domibacillus epiphyticus TaxID=1714355 RepID=A0A1V2AAI8_9BACI|nr:adenine deaminase C-terminal domain-containing protein [Domibacillus epiphyticus]OMP68013.1 adenosine deaminase [Domibacillus epiphyticus]
MPDGKYRWKNKQLREQIAVIENKKAPTLVLKNARYLHSALKRWMTGNIWVYEDRIVYIGDNMPVSAGEIYDCSGKTVVPGYIEPHVHPFLLYNPKTFAEYASQRGTTTFINDNLMMLLALQKKKAFSLIEELNRLPVSMYWWCRYDAQTEPDNEDDIFANGTINSWLEHDSVIQGGELTGWPKLLDGDDMMLYWMQETRGMKKRIEGHFPGASEKTLMKMTLLGADGDHESMSGQDVLKRLMNGMMVTLRHSSIRPDLEKLLTEMKELDLDQYDMMMFTTDGPSPSFCEEGITDRMIQIAINHGVPPIDAYHMASYNAARYYRMEHLHGMIAPGRLASVNILIDEFHPTPEAVLANGIWVKKSGMEAAPFMDVQWQQFGHMKMRFDWELTEDDLQFSMPFGIEMVNNVITKPCNVIKDMAGEHFYMDEDQNYLVLLDYQGKWRVNTTIKGFANNVQGFASSFSSTEDIVLIGSSKEEMKRAFDRMQEIGGGIVLSENGRIIHEIPLALSGIMSDQPFETVIEQERTLKKLLTERGYPFDDPIYSLLFLTSTHLPYIRLTSQGMYDVMKKTVLFPTIMR